jgi:hypothetical protein
MRNGRLVVVLILILMIVIENSVRFLDFARNDRKNSVCLRYRGDDFELDSDRRRQGADLDRRACWIWFALAGKMFGVKFVVDREILFYVRQEHGDIDDVVPIRASVFQHQPNVLKHRATLRFDVVTHNVAG